MFVPEIPLETSAELYCNDVTYLNVCAKENSSLSECDGKRVMELHGGFVSCEVNINVPFLNLGIFWFY